MSKKEKKEDIEQMIDDVQEVALWSLKFTFDVIKTVATTVKEKLDEEKND